MCFSVHVHLCALVCDLRVCIRYTVMCTACACMPVSVLQKKITPQEALKGLYYCIWTND